MRQRLITAAVALAVLYVVLFVAPPLLALAVFALVILAGAWEWSAFLGGPLQQQRVIYVTLVGLLLLVVTLGPAVEVRVVLATSLAWWAAALVWAFYFPTRIPPVVRWAGGVLVLVPLYLALVELYRAEPLTLLFALLVVWVADSGAYLAGTTLGRVKLAPKISPGKTWEGVIGGLLSVVLLTVVWSFWFNMNLAFMVPFCIAAASLSIVGDLTVSMFKRSVGLKDSGRLFPGHGGVLDRIDSVAAAAPLFALGMSWAGLR